MKSPIPIENLYYLFCYAWDRFPEGKAVEVGATDSPNVWDLFASVLSRGVTRLIRRGVDRGYTEIQDDAQSVRGRIVVGETIRRSLLDYGYVHCRFDELKHDVLHNQIIKATLRRLITTDELDPAVHDKVRAALRSMPEMSDIRLSSSLFRRVQLNRNNGHYDLLIRICELIHHALLPTETGASSRFASILEDDEFMGPVFEAFLRNFFKAEQSEFSVGSELIAWKATALSDGIMELLPTMRTDVTLRSKTRTVIMDAKYYKETFQSHRGRDKIRSAHLYQLFSYLKNLDGPHEPEGILVYPTASTAVDARYVLDNQSVRVVTLKLNQAWPKIHWDLLRILAANPVLPLNISSAARESMRPQ